MGEFFFTLQVRFGLNAYMRGDFAKAEAWLEKARRKEPDSLVVLRNLGLVRMALGDVEGAENYLLREEKLYGKSFHRHASLADVAYARGKRIQAAKRYALALKEPESLPGGSAHALRPLMEKRLQLCSDEKAFEAARLSMEAFERGQKLKAEGRHQEAVESYLESAEQDGTNWPALNNAAALLLESLGKPDEAAILFQKAFEISRNAQAARNLELARRKAAEKSGGKKSWKFRKTR
ncbi:MAG TPA: hypothetical protein VIO60_05840 [Rectinemataceae bacterium]